MAPEKLPIDGALRTVLHVLLAGEPLSRAGISRRTGLSKQTASQAVAALEEQGWIRPTGKTQGGLGRAAPTYEANPECGFAIGVDLGGTRLRVALADLSGAIIGEVDELIQPRRGVALIDRIGSLTAGMLAGRNIAPARLRGAAVAVAGVPDASSGAVLFAPNLPEFDCIDVRGEACRTLGCRVSVENDVNMAALGEQWLGKGGADFAFVAMGTGIGMGLVSGGRLIRGARGAAGEIAWLPLGTDPFDSRTRSVGPLEAAIGSQALVARRRGMGGGPGSVKALFDQLADGDAASEAVVDESARILALALVAVRAVVDPGRVVLGGSIGTRSELIDRVRAWLDRAGAADLIVEASTLGSRAGLMGAIALGVATAKATLIGEPTPESMLTRRSHR